METSLFTRTILGKNISPYMFVFIDTKDMNMLRDDSFLKKKKSYCVYAHNQNNLFFTTKKKKR